MITLTLGMAPPLASLMVPETLPPVAAPARAQRTRRQPVIMTKRVNRTPYFIAAISPSAVHKGGRLRCHISLFPPLFARLVLLDPARIAPSANNPHGSAVSRTHPLTNYRGPRGRTSDLSAICGPVISQGAMA